MASGHGAAYAAGGEFECLLIRRTRPDVRGREVIRVRPAGQGLRIEIASMLGPWRRVDVVGPACEELARGVRALRARVGEHASGASRGQRRGDGYELTWNGGCARRHARIDSTPDGESLVAQVRRFLEQA